MLAYRAGADVPPRTLVWVGRSGTEQPLSAPERAYDYPRISPDGGRIAVEIGAQIWLNDLTRDTLTRLTFEESGTSENPIWSHDGKRILFDSFRQEPAGQPATWSIFWQMADGSGGLEQLTTSDYQQTTRSWSSDGQLLGLNQLNPTTGRDIWVLRLNDRKAEPFLVTRFTEGAPDFSPDGRWLTYVSDESGRPEIYVQPYPGPGGKWQISTDGGTEPMWNRNGRELFYRSGARMMAVDVTTQPAFSAGKPRMLFERQYFSTPFPQTFPRYDVTRDGQRFLMIKQGCTSPHSDQRGAELDQRVERSYPARKELKGSSLESRMFLRARGAGRGAPTRRASPSRWTIAANDRHKRLRSSAQSSRTASRLPSARCASAAWSQGDDFESTIGRSGANGAVPSAYRPSIPAKSLGLPIVLPSTLTCFQKMRRTPRSAPVRASLRTNDAAAPVSPGRAPG